MALSTEFLDALGALAGRQQRPLTVPWPMPGDPGAFVDFASFGLWQKFVLKFSLRKGIPSIVKDEFDLAVKLHLLAWIDFSLIKAGELMALAALELALQDCYSGVVNNLRRADQAKAAPKRPAAIQRTAVPRRRKIEAIPFAVLLKYMPDHDGLTDAKIPMVGRVGGSVIGLLTGKRDPSLAGIRNTRAHGNPFGSGMQAGLLELIRDLIEYAYRNMPLEIAEQ